MNFSHILAQKRITVSVPCRIDMGGTLDISTFFLPLNHLCPGTVNIALNMRTTVTLSHWQEGRIKISSRGFETAECDARKAPFIHSMGLMFAVVRYFNGHGVHVHIQSDSPPRSALGGSSAAAVAMVTAFSHALGRDISPEAAATLAHHIESSVAGVPCGMQDQLAAAFGGVNAWQWTVKNGAPCPVQVPLLTTSEQYHRLNRHLLVAYCGVPHVSSDINKRWVNQFLSGKNRDKWEQIIGITEQFAGALRDQAFDRAAGLMNQETHIRLAMTPDVLDGVGMALFTSAETAGCGARFTGAGGGGCLWALGTEQALADLKLRWESILDLTDQGLLLDTAVDSRGIVLH